MAIPPSAHPNMLVRNLAPSHLPTLKRFMKNNHDLIAAQEWEDLLQSYESQDFNLEDIRSFYANITISGIEHEDYPFTFYSFVRGHQMTISELKLQDLFNLQSGGAFYEDGNYLKHIMLPSRKALLNAVFKPNTTNYRLTSNLLPHIKPMYHLFLNCFRPSNSNASYVIEELPYYTFCIAQKVRINISRYITSRMLDLQHTKISTKLPFAGIVHTILKDHFQTIDFFSFPKQIPDLFNLEEADEICKLENLE